MEAKFRFVSPLERALYLRTLNPATGLSPDEMALFAQSAREQFHRKGTVIVEPGKAVQSFHIIVEGTVSVDGAEHGSRTLGPEDSLGFLTMIAQWEEGLAATAETDTITLEVDADDFFEVLEDHFTILHYVIRNLAASMLAERQKIADGTYLAPAEGLMECPDRELDLIERLLFLRRGSAARLSNMDSLIEMAKNLKELRFQPGETLWKTGALSGFLYIVVDGTVECRLPDGRRFRAGPGYPLGNIESLAGEPRWYDAVTENRVVVLRGSTDGFIDIMEDHFEMARRFLAANAAGIIRILEQQRGREPEPAFPSDQARPVGRTPSSTESD